MSTDEIIAIATKYLDDNNIEQPHLRCIRVTDGLYLHLKEVHGIETKKEIYDIDMKHYNGDAENLPNEVLEHHCLRIGWRILDATASQFKNSMGNQMPRVYFGTIPLWYKQQS